MVKPRIHIPSIFYWALPPTRDVDYQIVSTMHYKIWFHTGRSFRFFCFFSIVIFFYYMNGLGLFGFRVLSFFFFGYSCKGRSGVLGWPCLLICRWRHFVWICCFFFSSLIKCFYLFMMFYVFCICFSVNVTLYRFYRERKCEELGD